MCTWRNQEGKYPYLNADDIFFSLFAIIISKMSEPKCVYCEEAFKNRRERKRKTFEIALRVFLPIRLMKCVEITDYICEKPCYFAYVEWRQFDHDLQQLFRNEEC